MSKITEVIRAIKDMMAGRRETDVLQCPVCEVGFMYSYDGRPSKYQPDKKLPMYYGCDNWQNCRFIVTEQTPLTDDGNE